MTVKVTMPNNSSDSVDFINATGTTLAQVKAYDDGSSNGHLELYTTASGTSTERVRVTSAGNVGIGTSSPTSFGGRTLQINDPSNGYAGLLVSSGAYTFEALMSQTNGVTSVGMRSNHPLVLVTNDTERARIDTSGNLLVGTTSGTGERVAVIGASGFATSSFRVSSNGNPNINFRNDTGTVAGSITTGASTTAYNTSSDYRLKENIKPMIGALTTVAQLKPVTYTWKVDGATGQGFIAHELQEVVPECVTGEKDAVDADGNPQYQGIDTSFLVATLTAAIQELSAKNDALEARLAALENK